MEHLNALTTGLMTNTEVLAVNQDELGMQAQRVDRQGSAEIWARPLWDGTVAVAMFNCGEQLRTVNMAAWDMLDPVLMRGTSPLRGAQSVRDLWRRKDMGIVKNFLANIPAHSAMMLKIGTPSGVDGSSLQRHINYDRAIRP